MHVKMHKRSLAFLLALVLLLTTFMSVAVVPASAAEADVASAAADVEVAEDAADVDAAATGVDYQPISGYTAPFGISVTTSDPYPWTVVDAGNNVLACGNHNIGSSSSYLKIVASFEGTLTFDYFASSESPSWDGLQILGVDGSSYDKIGENTSVTSLAGITSWENAQFDLAPGDTVIVKYYKDGSVNSGADLGWVKNIVFDTDVDPNSLSDTTIKLTIVNEGEGFSVSTTAGGSAITSTTGTAGNFVTLYASHPAAYGAAEYYSDASCSAASLVASGDSTSLAYGTTDLYYYVKFSKIWDVPAGYTAAPKGLSVLTYSAQYPWTMRETDGVQTVVSGNKGIHSSKSYLKLVAEEEGILSFDWRCWAESSSDYLCYKKNSETPTSSNKDAMISTKSGGGDKWVASADIVMSPGDYVMFAYSKDSSLNKFEDEGVLKNISFNTSIKNTTINFVCDETKGFISTANNTNIANKAAYSMTGIGGTAAGTFYVVPDYEHGYKFEGLYTTLDFQAASKVDPKNATSQYRTFTLNYPDDGTVTYYAKFVQQEAVTYTFDFDETIFSDVSVSVESAFNDVNSLSGQPYQRLTVSDPVIKLLNSGDTFKAYPGDHLEIDYTLDSDYVLTNITYTHGDESGVYGTSPLFYAESPENGYLLRLNAQNIGYQEIAGYQADNAKVYTRPVEYKLDSSYTNYPWTVSGGVLTPSNSGVNYTYAFLKIKAQVSGLLCFEYKISSEARYDILCYNSGSEPFPYSSAANYSNKNDYSGEVGWTQYTATVSSGDELYLAYYKDSLGAGGEDKAWIKNIGVYSGTPEQTVTSSNFALGSATAIYTDTENDQNNDTINAEATFNSPVGTSVTLTAVPETGAQFLKWVEVDPDTGDETSVCDTAEYTYVVKKERKLKAIFIPGVAEADAYFQLNNSAKFADYATAVSYASSGDVITLIKDYTLTQSITVPNGVTLLIPHNAAHTLYDNDSPGYNTSVDPFSGNSYTAPTKYCKLTVADNVNIDVSDGATLVVSGRFCHNSTRYVCTSGPYGQIDLNPQATITMHGSSRLLTWGYITGFGYVYANDHALVVELMQLCDFRGGNSSSQIAGDDHIFPFNQYYIQNIEAHLTLVSTATEKVHMVITTSWTNVSPTPIFFGDGGVFELEPGTTLTKYYNPDKDQMEITIDGDARLASLRMYMIMQIDSAEFILPLNDMVITQARGTLSTNNDVAILPDSGIIVNEGANVELGSSSEIYIIDDDDWDSYFSYSTNSSAVFTPVRYSPTRVGNPRPTPKSAFLKVDGTVTARGVLSTTVHGAEITSPNGTGSITFYTLDGGSYAAGVQNSNQGKKEELLTKCAMLLNNNGQDEDYHYGTYRESVIRTSTTEPVTFTVSPTSRKWTCGDLKANLIWQDRNGNILYRVDNVVEDQIDNTPYAGATPVEELDIPDPNPNANSKYYKFEGWNASAYDIETQNIVYTPAYKEYPYYHVTWKTNSGTALADTYLPYRTIPSNYRPEAVRAWLNRQSVGLSKFADGSFNESEVLVGNRTFTATLNSTANKKSFFCYYQNKYTNASTVSMGSATKVADANLTHGSAFTGFTTPTGSNLISKDSKYTADNSYGTFLGWYVTDLYGNPIDATNDEIITWNFAYNTTTKKTTETFTFSMTPSEAYLQGKIKVLYAAAQPADGLLLEGTTVNTTLNVPSSMRAFPVYNMGSTTENPVVVKYKVQFKNGSTVLQTGDFELNSAVSYTAAVPTQTSDDPRFSYSFSGWLSSVDGNVYASDAIPNVSGTVTYTAQFTRTYHNYDVTWLDEDGNQLHKDEGITYGFYPSYTPNVTSRESEENGETVTRFFIGWTCDGGTTVLSTNALPPVTDNVTYTAVYDAIFKKHSLTVRGNIGTNFLINVPAEYDPNELFVTFSWGTNAYDDNKPYSATSALTPKDVEGNTLYQATCNVAAKEMNDVITVTLTDKYNTKIATETYRASDYLYLVLTTNTDELATRLGYTTEKTEQFKDLCQKMLIYGASAQQYFGYNDTNLATYRFEELALSTSVPAVNTDALGSNDMTNLPEIYEYYGSSLNLGSDTSYDLCFVNRLKKGFTANAVVDGTDEVLATSTRSNDIAYVLRIENIPAARLTDDIKLTIRGSVVTVNAGEYIQKALEAGNDDLSATVTALYAYNQSAKAFFTN